jgi:ribonuclease HII
MPKSPTPHFDHEDRLIAQTGTLFAKPLVCGIDEVGRGPWAGPVVAAAVIIPATVRNQSWISELRDSKLLKAEKRETLCSLIQEYCLWGIGQATPEEIDRVNILQATWTAMQRALAALPVADHTCLIALVDGNLKPPGLPCPAEPLVKGDQHSCSIAAASIIAKVTRDRIMQDLCNQYPMYGFSSHVGYGTPAHQKALAEHGPCPTHRKSFKPIAELLRA